MFEDAQPHVAIAPPPVMNGPLQPFILGGFEPFPFYQTYGNVILKLNGSTLVNSFADLAKIQPGRFAKAGQTPLVGNQAVTMLATKTTTASTSPAAVDAFIDALKSPELTEILAETGLKRPDGFPSP